MKLLRQVGIGVAIGLLILSAGALLFGCPKPGPTPVTPPDASDAAPAPPSSCDEACAHLRQLGCKGSRSCNTICSRVLSDRYWTCVARAPSCDAINACDHGVGNE